MFLIVVTDLDFGPQGISSLIGIQKSVEDLQHSGLACSVVSDQGDPFSSFDLEGYIGKKRLSGKTFRQVFHGKHVVSADCPGLQGEAHLCLDLYRFFDALHLVQHFFTAFRSADGLLPVEGFQFDDHCFLMFDLSLLVQIGLILGVS